MAHIFFSDDAGTYATGGEITVAQNAYMGVSNMTDRTLTITVNGGNTAQLNVSENNTNDNASNYQMNVVDTDGVDPIIKLPAGKTVLLQNQGSASSTVDITAGNIAATHTFAGTDGQRVTYWNL